MLPGVADTRTHLLEHDKVLARGERPLHEGGLVAAGLLLRDPKLVLEGDVGALLPPTDAAALIRAVRREVGLVDLELLKALQPRLQLRVRRPALEQKLARDGEGRGHADEVGDARDGATDLLLKRRRVVDNVQVLVTRPAVDGLQIHLPRLRRRLVAGHVVGERVKGLGAVGRSDEVQDRIVPLVAHHHRRQLRLLQ